MNQCELGGGLGGTGRRLRLTTVHSHLYWACAFSCCAFFFRDPPRTRMGHSLIRGMATRPRPGERSVTAAGGFSFGLQQGTRREAE
jgi:hypothetical protein